MSTHAFVASLACGAVLLAFWVDARLGGRTPSTPRAIFLHSVAAYVALQLMGVVAGSAVALDSRTQTLVVVFTIVLPPFVYAFLAAIWLLKLLWRLQLR